MVLKDEPVEILSSKYGLWDEFVKLYKEKRGPTLWPPQVSALENGALDNKNFLMVSSAGSGKTHIAEIIIFHSVIKKTKPAVYLAPYNALVEQKTDDFKDLMVLERGWTDAGPPVKELLKVINEISGNGTAADTRPDEKIA